MKIRKKELLFTTLLCLLPILVGGLLYDRLPEMIATHFGINGEENGWSSRAFTVFCIPTFMAGINLLLCFFLYSDPKREHMSPALCTLSIWSVPLLSVITSFIILGKALGYIIYVETIIPILIGVLFIAIGNYLPKTKQNYTIGIKLPWTLASEENWNRTHRITGFLWVVGGIVTLLFTILHIWNEFLFLVLLIILVIIPSIYSYLLYKKGI